MFPVAVSTVGKPVLWEWERSGKKMWFSFLRNESVRKWCSVALLNVFAMAVSAAQSGDFTYATNINNAVSITGYTGSGGDVTIPGTLDGKTVTVIGDRAFQDCDTLTGVTLPDSVTNIEEDAFTDCTGLTNVWLGAGVRTIGEDAFDSCTALTGIVIPDSVVSLGVDAFIMCGGMTNAVLGGGLTEIGG